MSEFPSSEPKKVLIGINRNGIMNDLLHSAISGIRIVCRNEADVLDEFDKLTVDGFMSCRGTPQPDFIYVCWDKFSLPMHQTIFRSTGVRSIIWLELNPRTSLNKMYIIPLDWA